MISRKSKLHLNTCSPRYRPISPLLERACDEIRTWVWCKNTPPFPAPLAIVRGLEWNYGIMERNWNLALPNRTHKHTSSIITQQTQHRSGQHLSIRLTDRLAGWLPHRTPDQRIQSEERCLLTNQLSRIPALFRSPWRAGKFRHSSVYLRT